VARLCPANKRKLECLVAKPKKGLKQWFGKGPKGDWVDISAPKEGGGFEKCGRKSAKDSKRGYPKCVPASTASGMSKKEIASAVSRKRSKKQGVGGKPTNVKTFARDGGEIVRMKSKMGTKGGAMGGKKKMMMPGGMKNGGTAKKGGKVAPKGMAKGGKIAPKGAAKGGMRKPSNKKSGLFGRR